MNIIEHEILLACLRNGILIEVRCNGKRIFLYLHHGWLLIEVVVYGQQ